MQYTNIYLQIYRSFLEAIFDKYKELDATIAIKECSNKKLQLPEYLPIKFELLPKNQSVEIVFTYQNKIDYYEFDWNGSVRNIETRLDEIPIKQSEEFSYVKDVVFKCPYSVLDDRDYTIIAIESTSSVQDNLPDAYVYFVNKETFEVTRKFYPSYYECITCH